MVDAAEVEVAVVAEVVAVVAEVVAVVAEVAAVARHDTAGGAARRAPEAKHAAVFHQERLS